MDIQLIVCDLAGTTVEDNQEVHKALQHAMQKFNVRITLEQANEVMGIPKPVAIRQLLEENKVRTIDDTLIHHIHNAFVTEMVTFYQSDPSVREKEGVSETFRTLKENNIKVVIDTGFNRPIANAIIHRLGWESKGLIFGSVTSDEVLKGRPHPDLIFAAMKLGGITDSKKVAKVGDTLSDLMEGNSAGCGLVIGVTTGAFTWARLASEKHTHLIEQIPELLDILQINQPVARI